MQTIKNYIKMRTAGIQFLLFFFFFVGVFASKPLNELHFAKENVPALLIFLFTSLSFLFATYSAFTQLKLKKLADGTKNPVYARTILYMLLLTILGSILCLSESDYGIPSIIGMAIFIYLSLLLEKIHSRT
jgi:hypothetical protein